MFVSCAFVAITASPARHSTDMTAAMEWRWQDEVPPNLRLLRGDWLRTAGVEHWHGWDFIMLDYWDRDTGRYLARYAAWPDWHWHWKPVGPMLAGTINYGWEPDIRIRGRMLVVRECRWRGKNKGTLVHIDDNNVTMSIFFCDVSFGGATSLTTLIEVF